MIIDFFCPRWGSENIKWEIFLADVKKAGYTGIEWFPTGEKTEHQKVLSLLQQHELQFCVVMAVMGQHDFENHLAALKKQLLDICELRDGEFGPLFITAQTGREYYTQEQVEECILCCHRVTHQTGVPVYQETHRNKWAYAAHVVYPFLERHPDLLITLDISHWYCVSESYLEDQQYVVEKAIEHARHIHARVGHTEGPQVFDPSAPEYAEALEAHLKVWDKYIQSKLQQGADKCTITPEFGPPPYMVFGNREGSPHEEQWRQNYWMKTLLEKRYDNLLNKNKSI